MSPDERMRGGNILGRRTAAAAGLLMAFTAFSGAMTLEEAVRQALETHPSMESAAARLEAAKSGLSQAQASYLPGVSLSGAYTHGNPPVYAFGTRLSQARFEASDFQLDKLNHPPPVDNLQGQAMAQIPLWDWQRNERLKAARSGSLAAEQDRRVVRQTLIAQTIEAYFGLMLARKCASILEKRIAESEAELKDANRLKDQGLVLGSDYHLAKSILGRLRQQLAEARSQARAAEAGLNILLSKPETDPIPQVGELAVSNAPALDLTELQGGLSEHPLLRNARFSAEGARADAKAESRGRWPAFSGFGSVEGNGYRADEGGWNYLAGIKLGVPLFDPGQGPRTRQKDSLARHANAAQKMAEDSLKAELQRRFHAYESARERLELARQTEEESRSALALFKKLYRSGRQSIADVLQGEAALAQNQFELERVHYDLRAGYARTLEAAGRLTDVPDPYAR